MFAPYEMGWQKGSVAWCSGDVCPQSCCTWLGTRHSPGHLCQERSKWGWSLLGMELCCLPPIFYLGFILSEMVSSKPFSGWCCTGMGGFVGSAAWPASRNGEHGLASLVLFAIGELRRQGLIALLSLNINVTPGLRLCKAARCSGGLMFRCGCCIRPPGKLQIPKHTAWPRAGT